MKKTVFLTILLFFNLLGFGQTRVITGRILDSRTKEPVKSVSIIKFGTVQGSVTNASGYFQMEIQNGITELIISHISYETSKVLIPLQNVFTILIVPKLIRLPTLDLSYIPTDSTEQILFTRKGVLDQFEITEEDAKYKTGWEDFYAELGKLIIYSEEYKYEVLDCTVRFSIDPLGSLQNLHIDSDSLPNKEIILRSFEKMIKWTPAQQHEEFYQQNFEIRIKKTEEKFEPVEVQPSPPGGMSGFYRYINENINYPTEARRLGIEGEVYVQFVVDKDGSLTEIQVMEGLGAGCDSEAIRLVSEAPKWIPGSQKGRPVKVRMILPITFSLDGTLTFSHSSLYKFLGKSMKYPNQARRMGIEGIVYVKFTIDEFTQQIGNTEVLKDIGAGCAEEVINVVKIIPQVHISELLKMNSSFILPVSFGLGEEYEPNETLQSNSNEETVLSILHIIAIGINRISRSKSHNSKNIRIEDFETSAKFPGGFSGLSAFLKKNNRYLLSQPPPNRVANRVRLEFEVAKDGTLQNLKIISSLDEIFDKEAIRLFSAMPKWIPATLYKVPVKSVVHRSVEFGNINISNQINAQNHYYDGIKVYEKNQYEKALKKFSKAIDLNPTVLNYYFDRAALYLQLERRMEGCADLILIKDKDEEANKLHNEYCN